MDPKYGSGTCNHSRTDTVVTENETEASSPIIFLLDFKNESESRTSSDAILNESASGSTQSSELSRSIFSSSSGSSSDDFILVNPKIASNSISLDVPSSKYSRDAKPLSQDDYNSSNGVFYKLELNRSTSPATQLSDISDESLLPNVLSITKSPSIQMMERQGGYDPNRVPSSIFGSISSTPKEWSAASDESLFSINVSLPRDHILLMGEDIWKSGELHKSGELKNKCAELDRSEEVSKSGKLISFRDSPTVKGGKHTEKICDTERGVVIGNNLIEAGGQHEPINKELHFEEEIKVGQNAEYSTTIGHSKGNEGFIDPYSTIHHSDRSGTSLAFAVSGKSEPFCHIVYYTRKKSIWPLCLYSYCSCGSCCSRWPSSCFKCSGCLSCKWSSWICCSCKWLSWSGCCHKLSSR